MKDSVAVAGRSIAVLRDRAHTLANVSFGCGVAALLSFVFAVGLAEENGGNAAVFSLLCAILFGMVTSASFIGMYVLNSLAEAQEAAAVADATSTSN